MSHNPTNGTEYVEHTTVVNSDHTTVVNSDHTTVVNSDLKKLLFTCSQ